MQNFSQQVLKSTTQLFDIPESNFPAFYEHNWDRPSNAIGNPGSLFVLRTGFITWVNIENIWGEV